MPQEIIPFVLLDIALVIGAARLVGSLFRRMGQPAVIGEIVAGIMLGPSLLGLLPGDLHLVLFPMSVRPYLTVLAQVGLVLFMFIVGLEVDLGLVRRRRGVAGAVSLTSIALPFVLGVLLATVLYVDHSAGVAPDRPPPSFLAFALFLGVAMSITAFPVLARIITARRMQQTPVGVLALACAAVDDVVAWSLLALVVAVTVGGTFAGVGIIVALSVAYALVMFLGIRPLLARLVDRFRTTGRLTSDMLAVILAGLMLSACATEAIGIHAIFGAFVFGVIMPRGEPRLTREVLERLEQVSLLLLLPIFFVVAGLQVDIRGIGPRELLELVAILAVAIGGKFLGAMAAARLRRVPQRQAAALGVLMNTRGLTEIVILQIGAQLGVLDERLFTLMVLMALITTIMTTPLLRRVYPDRIVARDVAAAERAELGDAESFGVLVSVPEEAGEDGARDLAALGSGLAGHQQPARMVLVRLLPASRTPLELASGLGSELMAVTAAGDRLRALAAPGESAGLPTRVVARFSAAAPADLAALARDSRADVVVMPESGRAGPEEAPAFPDTGDAALVVVRPAADPRRPVGPDGPPVIQVLVDDGGGGRAAVRLGGRLAVHHGAAITVGGVGAAGRRSGRRAASAVQALRRLGLDAVSADATTPDGAPAAVPDLLLLPEGAPEPAVAPSTTVITVRPAPSDLDDDLGEVVARIPTAP